MPPSVGRSPRPVWWGRRTSAWTDHLQDDFCPNEFWFDKALQKLAHRARLKPECDSGDHLHPTFAENRNFGEGQEMTS
jgi:hypothetical protein